MKRPVKIELLADRHDAISTVGRWYHKEWGVRLRGETEQQSIDRLQQFLNHDKIPFIILATVNNAIAGAVQLKFKEMERIYPDKLHWLGGLFVAPEYRGNGIGSLLAETIVDQAPLYGVETLYLQTEQLDGGLYARLGWTPIEKVNNKDLRVLVMERRVSA